MPRNAANQMPFENFMPNLLRLAVLLALSRRCRWSALRAGRTSSRFAITSAPRARCRSCLFERADRNRPPSLTADENRRRSLVEPSVRQRWRSAEFVDHVVFGLVVFGQPNFAAP